jgi:hypothetical protein
MLNYRESMATESFFHRGRAAGSVDQVWRNLQDPITWQQIGGVREVWGASFDESQDLVGYHFMIVVAGTEYRGRATRQASEPLRHLLMGIDSTQLVGEIVVELEPDYASTWVDLSLSMRSTGLISAMVFPAITRAVAGGFEEAARSFVAELSSS